MAHRGTQDAIPYRRQTTNSSDAEVIGEGDSPAGPYWKRRAHQKQAPLPQAEAVLRP
jgi:hypothetical protein